MVTRHHYGRGNRANKSGGAKPAEGPFALRRHTINVQASQNLPKSELRWFWKKKSSIEKSLDDEYFISLILSSQIDGGVRIS